MENLPFELTGDEQVFRNETALWMKAKLNAQAGRLYLTDQRILFVKNQNPLAGVLLKLLVKSARGGVLYDIPLSDIKSFSRESFGANKNILKLSYGDGETVKFSLNKNYEEWEDELKRLGN